MLVLTQENQQQEVSELVLTNDVCGDACQGKQWRNLLLIDVFALPLPTVRVDVDQQVFGSAGWKKKKKATVSLKVSQSQALSSACVGDKSYWLQRAAPWCCWPSAHTGPPLDMWRWLQHTASSAADTSPHITLQQNRHTQTTDDFIINNLIFPEGFWMFCLLFISFTFEEGTTTRMSLVTQKPLDFLKPWWSTEQAFIQIYLLSDI